MMRAIVAVLALSLSTTASAAEAPGPPTPTMLYPLGPWNMNYSPDECRIIRDFGEGAKKISLMLVRSAGPNRFDIIISGKAFPTLKDDFSVEVTLVPQNRSFKFIGFTARIPKRPDLLILGLDGDIALLASINSAQQLTISAGGVVQASLELAGAKGAVAALNKCYAELLTSWGVTPAESAVLQDRPVPVGDPGAGNPGTMVAVLVRGSVSVSGISADGTLRYLANRDVRSKLPPPPPPLPANWANNWVTPNDYPSETLRQGISGPVSMLLALNAEGKVDRCRVLNTSKSDILDRTSCELLTKRAHYQPKRDASGNPVPSNVIERILWLISIR